MEGDTHVTTVNGVHYDFQGAGEFISLRDADGSEIQTRMTPVPTTTLGPTDAHDGLSTCVSLNTAVAVHVNNHRVTYQPNISGVPDPSGMQLRIDSNLTTLGPGGIDLGPDARVVKSSTPGGILVDFPNGTVLSVVPLFWPSQGKWYLNVDYLQTPSLEGIAGATLPGSWLPALPDGTSVGPLPGSLDQRYADLYQKFGEAWRVTDYNSLFDYKPGTSTATFTDKTWPPRKAPCTVPEARPVRPVSLQLAQGACRAIRDKNAHADCVFDVMVTGHTGFAQIYQQSQRMWTGATTIVVTDNGDPTTIGEPVTFTAIVTPVSETVKGVPAGTVQFVLDGHNVGEPVKLDATGRAYWTTSNLTPGRLLVTATYIPAASGVFLASTSDGHTHNVKR
jgi:hypothetical protein